MSITPPVYEEPYASYAVTSNTSALPPTQQRTSTGPASSVAELPRVVCSPLRRRLASHALRRNLQPPPGLGSVLQPRLGRWLHPEPHVQRAGCAPARLARRPPRPPARRPAICGAAPAPDVRDAGLGGGASYGSGVPALAPVVLSRPPRGVPPAPLQQPAPPVAPRRCAAAPRPALTLPRTRAWQTGAPAMERAGGAKPVRAAPSHLLLAGNAVLFGLASAAATLAGELAEGRAPSDFGANVRASATDAADAVTPVGAHLLRNHVMA